MSHLDDLPKRGDNRRLQEQSETAFQAEIIAAQELVIQSRQSYDYGTDYDIETVDGEVMTNVHVHVQLKGTMSPKNSDGSVSISVKRTTLNYLAMAFGSIFVCYHVPSKKLLACRVDDVLRNYEHSGSTWVNQTTVTVRFFRRI